MTPKTGRVVMVSPNFYPYVGGAEKQALELSKALASAGVAVQVLTRRVGGAAPEEAVQGIQIHRLTAWGGGFINSTAFMISSFAWLMSNRSNYDAIHVHLAGSQALAAAAAGAMLGKRVVIKLGGGRGIGEIAVSSRTIPGRLKLKLFSALRPQLVAVVGDLVDELKEHGLGDVPVVVIPNGVDTSRYHPASESEKQAARKELGLGGLCFLFVGRLSVEKQLPLFLELFAEAVRDSKKDGTLILVGAGPEEPKLRRRSAELNIEKWVRFEAPTHAIERFYAAADIFVLPSISEGFSNSLLEAMSAGLGVLASRVGGMKEAIAEGINGLLFDPDSREQMKAQLLRYLREPELCKKLGGAARQTAAERYGLSAVAQRYIELYNF